MIELTQPVVPGETMSNLKVAIARSPIIGPVALTLFRLNTAIGYFGKQIASLFKWLIGSREITNFTYNLTARNMRYLAALISDVTGVNYDTVAKYIKEIEDDAALRLHIADATARSDRAFMADKEVRFGKRMGWYAFVRALKPEVVVETGVDKGMGACVLTAALKRNMAEGYEGRYYGTDINPKAGYLLSGEYAQYGKILYGDSIESLAKLDGKIDLFVNDSDHSAEYEAREYETVADKLSDRAVILGDNSHGTDKLLDFSLKTGRHFLFFQEKPLSHWYPGGGIGISFRK
jgi:predicted O-methyltransferase YrrM